MKELGWGRHSTSAVGRGFELGLSQAGAQTLNPSCILSLPLAYPDSYAVRWWFLRTKSITKISSSTLDIKAISVYRVPPDQKLMYECVYVYICIHHIYFTCTYEIHILKTYLNNNKKSQFTDFPHFSLPASGSHLFSVSASFFFFLINFEIPHKREIIKYLFFCDLFQFCVIPSGSVICPKARFHFLNS